LPEFFFCFGYSHAFILLKFFEKVCFKLLNIGEILAKYWRNIGEILAKYSMRSLIIGTQRELMRMGSAGERDRICSVPWFTSGLLCPTKPSLLESLGLEGLEGEHLVLSVDQPQLRLAIALF